MSDTSPVQPSIFSDMLVPLKPVTAIFADYPVVLTLLIFVVGLIFASVTTSIVIKMFGHMVRKTNIQWDDQVILAFRKPMFWSLVFIGVLLALEPMSLSSARQEVIQSIIATTLILIWTRFSLRLTRIILRAMSRSARENSMVRPQTRPLFENLGYILTLAVSIYLIFRSWDIDMTAWLASAGVIGIAVGFAAKDTLANLFSGVFILADAPYKIGDYVVLDSGERGKVTHIGIRSTRLLTRSDVEITIPNSIMGNTRVINESGGPHEKYRNAISIGVAYGSDIDLVKSVLMEIAINEPQVCADPEPKVRFRSFGASSLDLELLCWTETPEERGRVLDILNTTIYKRFIKEGIEIPYSKQDLYIKEMPSR